MTCFHPLTWSSPWAASLEYRWPLKILEVGCRVVTRALWPFTVIYPACTTSLSPPLLAVVCRPTETKEIFSFIISVSLSSDVENWGCNCGRVVTCFVVTRSNFGSFPVSKHFLPITYSLTLPESSIFLILSFFILSLVCTWMFWNTLFFATVWDLTQEFLLLSSNTIVLKFLSRSVKPHGFCLRQ